MADYDLAMPERISFRAYTAIMYLDPRMKIYIQGKKVRTKRLTTCLYNTKCYDFTSKRFKTRSEQESEKAVREAKIAEEKARELETQARELQKQAEQTSKDKRAELRKAQGLATAARADAQMKTNIAEAKKKSMKEPKTLNFTFGFNIENRRYYGMFIYNCSRLIKMYEKVGPQKEGGVKCYGIIGVVDVPYLVLEPTHNKQDFADGKEFKQLQRALGEHLEQYWKDSKIESQGVTKFWEDFGYVGKWADGPSMDQKFARKRAMQIPLNVQCDICLKWRKLPFAQKNVGRQLPDEWCCAMHPESDFNSCDRPEQVIPIKKGTLQKQTKSAEEKAKELQDEIRKKREKLSQVERQRPQVAQATTQKRVERVSSAESTSSSTGDTTERRVQRRPVADSTEVKRTKSTNEPLKRRNTTSPIAVEAKRKKNEPQATKTVVRKEHQEQREQQIKRREELKKEEQRKKEEAEKRIKEEKEKQKKIEMEQQRQRQREEKERQRKQEELEQENKKEKEQEQQRKKDEKEQEQLEMEQLMEWSSEGETDATTLSKGTKVEARVDNSNWYIGTVFASKPKKGFACRVRVKFDMYPKDKYDKWFDHPSEDLRVLKPVEESAPKSPSPSREVSSSTIEAPSSQQEQDQKTQPPARQVKEPVQSPEDNRVSSMSDDTLTADQEHPALKDVVGLFRRCLCYFAPPSFKISKEDIKEMGTEELREFPLDSFIDDYEKGISELIDGFRKKGEEADQRATNAEQRLAEANSEKERSTNKLKNLRKNAGKLLRFIQEDPNDCAISEDDVSDKVDEMMENIAQQAEDR